MNRVATSGQRAYPSVTFCAALRWLPCWPSRLVALPQSSAASMINFNPRTVALELLLGACALCEGLHEVFMAVKGTAGAVHTRP
jgi:hypothetical protein